jgi:hypothetical protein
MPSEVRFSRAQKWDLVRMSAAAVASTVFFTVPIFLVRQNPTPQSEQPPATVPVAALVSQTAAPDQITPSSSPVTSVSVVTSTEFAIASTPVLQPAPQRARPQSRPDLRAHANVNTAPPQRSFTRRLARFFSGVGKYAVKPFPSINRSGN